MAGKKSSSKALLVIVIGLWAGILLGAVVVGVLAWGGLVPLINGSAEDDQTGVLARLESGTVAPDFEVADLSGNPVKLSDLRGKVVLLNFWATWCGPCVQEMPMFQEYQERTPNLVILGVNEEETADVVKSFFEQISMYLTYPILLDVSAEVARLYRVTFLPTSLFIDKKGEIRFRHSGVMSRQQMEYYLETLSEVQP